ncbi:MAG: dethiobiotin synthase [Ottowia sp.]|nr:dethiobiotin synthase [Ottowia sp.]
MNKKQALFVCGTDTHVGKTIVSAWLAHHWQATYWKPIQSGLEEDSDSQRVAALANVTCHAEAWRLKAPLSPHQAAAQEGIDIQLHHLTLPSTPRLVVEGAGGLLTPLNKTQCIAHLIAQLNLPVLLVARTALGTINHTCLTIEAIRARGITLLGVVMVGDKNAAQCTAIEHYAQTSVLAEIPWFTPLNPSQLAQLAMPTLLKTALAHTNITDQPSGYLVRSDNTRDAIGQAHNHTEQA